MQEYPEPHSDREKAILYEIKDIDHQLRRGSMNWTLYEETPEELREKYEKERALLLDQLEPVRVNQKQVKIITNPFESKNPTLPMRSSIFRTPIDQSNYIAQCCAAACLGYQFENVSGFTPLIPKLSDIPELISNMEPETGIFEYASPFGAKVTKTNWLDWFFYTPENEADARKLHNLEKIYQMTGTIPAEFVPYIPQEFIFINPKRVETHIPINEANERGNPIYYDATTDTWKFGFGGPREKKKDDDEPKSIELVENKPAKLSQMEMMVIGKYVGIKDLETIKKTNKEYATFCKNYNKLPNDIDDIEDLDNFELNQIIDSNFEVQGNGVYEPLSIHEAHFMVRFLLYMNEICKEMGYFPYEETGKRSKNHWKSKLLMMPPAFGTMIEKEEGELPRPLFGITSLIEPVENGFTFKEN